MKVLIFGASGSGTTTLGIEVARQTGYVHLDADDYYWKKTMPPFQRKISPLERDETLRADFFRHKNVIVSGSLNRWREEWKRLFDWVVFIRLKDEWRMQRLEKRELERYGDALNTDAEIWQRSKAFLEWAGQYEDPTFEGRSLRAHRQWLTEVSCPVLPIDGAMELSEKAKRVVQVVK